jgi:hypothetical protein
MGYGKPASLGNVAKLLTLGVAKLPTSAHFGRYLEYRDFGVSCTIISLECALNLLDSLGGVSFVNDKMRFLWPLVWVLIIAGLAFFYCLLTGRSVNQPWTWFDFGNE